MFDFLPGQFETHFKTHHSCGRAFVDGGDLDG
jgi:hypothetical protein